MKGLKKKTCVGTDVSTPLVAAEVPLILVPLSTSLTPKAAIAIKVV